MGFAKTRAAYANKWRTTEERPSVRPDAAKLGVYVREKLAAIPQYPEANAKRPPNSPSSVVIVGGGAAGLAAADMLRRKGYDGPVTIISADDAAPYDRPVNGRDEIIAFLSRKWARELDYRLIKELWAFTGNRIAVRFAYEWHDDSGHWYRSYGNENWEYNADGLMAVRHASINDHPILESDRKYHWPLGRRPDGHPGLSDLGF